MFRIFLIPRCTDAVISRFGRNEFDLNYTASIGARATKKILTVDERNIMAQVWDDGKSCETSRYYSARLKLTRPATAGNERHRAVASAYVPSRNMKSSKPPELAKTSMFN